MADKHDEEFISRGTDHLGYHTCGSHTRTRPPGRRSHTVAATASGWIAGRGNCQSSWLWPPAELMTLMSIRLMFRATWRTSGAKARPSSGVVLWRPFRIFDPC